METTLHLAPMVRAHRACIEAISAGTSSEAGKLIRSILLDEFAQAARTCADTDLADMLAAYSEAGSAAWVAICDGTVCGTAAVRECPDGALKLSRLYVDRENRGQGVGGLLLRTAHEWAETQGYQQIVLTTTPLMERAQAVYRSFGYVLSSTDDSGDVELRTYRRNGSRAPLGSRTPVQAMPHVVDGAVGVVVERPRGSCEGWHADQMTEQLILTEYYDRPVPVNYGFAPAWLNRADGDALDVILLDDRRMRPGETLLAVPAGVLVRGDGDHKLLAIPEGGAARPVPLNETTKRRVSSWWDAAHQPVGWQGADGVEWLLGKCERK